MRPAILSSAFFLLSCLTLGSSHADVKEEITKMQKAYDAAVVARDTKTLEQLLDEDGQFCPTDGRLLGRAEYIATVLVNQKETFKTAATDIHSIKSIDDAALQIGTWKATGTDDGKPIGYTIRVTAVWHKKEGKWLLAAEHSTLINGSTDLAPGFDSEERQRTGTVEQPKPIAEHKQLERWAGKWTYSGVGHANPFFPAGKFNGALTRHLVLGGFFLEERWEDRGESGYLAQGITLWGYDPAKKSFTQYAFENDGSVSPILFEVDGNSWTGKSIRTDREGKSYEVRAAYRLSEAGTTEGGKVEYSADGGNTWKPWYDITFKKAEE